MSRRNRRDRVVAWLRRIIRSRVWRFLWRALGALAVGFGVGFGPRIAPPPPPPVPPTEQTVEEVLERTTEVREGEVCKEHLLAEPSQPLVDRKARVHVEAAASACDEDAPAPLETRREAKLVHVSRSPR